MKKVLFLISISCVGLLFSCKKANPKEEEKQPDVMKLVTAAGTPIGNKASKTIGAAGGSLTSADGKITVTLPQGALSSNQAITIEPVTKKLEVGYGNAYRITPHMSFSKPVSISFKYAEANRPPEALGVGYQDDKGAWFSVKKVQVDKVAKTLTVATSHFSDWTFFTTLILKPEEARVQYNQTVNLEVLTTVGVSATNDPDDLFVPIVTTPYRVPTYMIKGWQYSGQGSLNASGATAVYTAPNKTPAQNPEAVSVEVDPGVAGKFVLVSNITVQSQFRIDYLQVDETETADYVSRLFIYGNFGDDPGAGKRSIKINNVDVTTGIKTWARTLIICEISAIGPASSGNVVVTANSESASKILNEWLVTLEHEKTESPNGALNKKLSLILKLRGDALGYSTGPTQPILSTTDLNKSSKVLINIAGGSFQNSVDNIEACGTYHVKWTAVSNVAVARKLYSANDGLRGRVVQTATGFKIKLYFEEDNILKSTRTFTPCFGPVNGPTLFQESVSFSSYEDEEIELLFSSVTSSGSAIKAGGFATETATGAATGLYWNASDVPATLPKLTTKLSWAAASAKW